MRYETQKNRAAFFDYEGFRCVELPNRLATETARKVWVRRREAP